MSGAMKKLMAHADLVAAVAVVLVVVMMIVPLPPGLIDLFITLNIASAITIVVATLYVPRALDFAAFPSLLLLTTMFRLAINVSVTRQILLHGDGGSVVKAFGSFVVGGNVVVGLVVFLILIVIQFVVVTNGAGRVAEVAARFTLDAMPGKQMAIDADLNAGQINDQQAHERRDDIAREADFYGAMDGASKFVKGDAIAGILIVMINLIGGIVVGVMQQHLSFPEAVQHYSLLTVGDGLAAQIPALLISVAAGILVTRSASDRDLGNDIAGQIFAQRKAPMVAAGVICAFALVPGLPKIPFLLIGGALAGVAYALKDGMPQPAGELALAGGRGGPPQLGPGGAPELPAGPTVDAATAVDPLELAIGFGLVPMVEAGQGGGLMGRVGAMRKQLAGELGTVIPAVRIHDELGLDSHEYVLRVRGSEVARGRIMPGHQLAMDSGEGVGQLPGVPTTEPAFGLPATWVPDAARAEAEALGYTVVDPESVIATHLTETIRGHAAELLTRQETKKLLDGLKETNAAAVEEVVPEQLSLGEVQRVLQALLREGVPIRDLGAIVEEIGDKSRLTRDPAVLAEYARAALGRTITAPHLDAAMRLRAISLDPAIEQEIGESLAQTPDGEQLAMEPSRAQALVAALGRQLDSALAQGARPVLLCSGRARRHLRRLCEQSLPQLTVCSYNEIVPGIRVENMGVVQV
ncbi:MAG TPA: flagellar biosynthesis protein FlhA [Solirubrobacterales bacterium]|nr:flagellar biosynthesis protein FlhA [Solirubrobacterales bacterium]